MEIFFLYLWMQVNVFIEVAATVSIVGLLACLIGSIPIFSETQEEFRPSAARIWKKCLIGFTVLGVFAVLMPNSNTIAVMTAGHYALEFAKSETGQKVQSLILEKANEILDEELAK